MQLEHSFTVPAPVEEAWAVLRDVERIAPCMPGATIESVEGEQFRGKVKVKVGPITVTYRGEARFTDLDEQAHTATVEARGKETRGSGTANATVTARLTERDGRTDVVMTTDLTVTGKPAQFGRGVMVDVGSKLVGQFADCLSRELAVAEPDLVPEPAEAAAAEGVAAADRAAAERAAPPEPGREAAAAQPSRPRPAAEAIDLFDVAGAPVAKRLAPVAGAVALLAIIVWLIRRRD